MDTKSSLQQELDSLDPAVREAVGVVLLVKPEATDFHLISFDQFAAYWKSCRVPAVRIMLIRLIPKIIGNLKLMTYSAQNCEQKRDAYKAEQEDFIRFLQFLFTFVDWRHYENSIRSLFEIQSGDSAALNETTVFIEAAALAQKRKYEDNLREYGNTATSVLHDLLKGYYFTFARSRHEDNILFREPIARLIIIRLGRACLDRHCIGGLSYDDYLVMQNLCAQLVDFNWFQ